MDSTEQLVNPGAWISQITFSDGTVVSLNADDIVILVGPNNSGKSAALRDIEMKTQDKAAQTVVVKSVEIETAGNPDELCAWLERNARKSLSNPSNPTYTRMGASVAESQAKAFWATPENGLKQLAKFFVYHLSTDERLRAADPAPNIALTKDPLTHPIHYMQIDGTIEEEVSTYFQEAFGEDLIIHRNAGNQVPLHCGLRPKPKLDQDRVSMAYLKELEKLPTLHTQGDGMRSFVGVILHSLVVARSVVMIDEPEAFLHPPQARLLGQMLVKKAPKDRQFFFATHSGDFLRGLLDIHSKRVRVLRVQRENDINPITELDNQGIDRIWGDPILRYSNVLDGLFHNKVILCESDGDCRFYAAVIDSTSDQSGIARREHTMFLHCGGKARMPVVVESLRNLNVPVRVIVDFDVLNNETPLKNIIEALGGDWNTLKNRWRKVCSAIEKKKPELSTQEVSKEIGNILKKIKDPIFPVDAKKTIQTILRRSTPWATAKEVGKSYIPSGDPTIAFEELNKELESLGLFVVPVGELEGFDRSVPSHGIKWVNAVLTKQLDSDPGLEDARSFVNRLLE